MARSGDTPTVRAELVEALSFFVPLAPRSEEEGQGFDKLSPNGIWVLEMHA